MTTNRETEARELLARHLEDKPEIDDMLVDKCDALAAISNVLRQRDEAVSALAKCDPHEDHKCVLCGRPELMHAPTCPWLRAVALETFPELRRASEITGRAR